MEPVTFFQKGEILLGGFWVGSDIGSRWDRYEREEKIAKLSNTVDDSGFELRLFLPDELRIFTGVEVSGGEIVPPYELLALPSAFYAMFEIDCGDDIDRQFGEVDAWIDGNRDKYGQLKWESENAPYRIIWAGRYAEENICEMWIPFLDFRN